MKINECAVVDNKVIDVRLRILLEQIKLAKRNGGVKDLNELSEKVNDIIDIVNNLKPLEPIVRDAYQQGMIDGLTNTQTKTEI